MPIVVCALCGREIEADEQCHFVKGSARHEGCDNVAYIYDACFCDDPRPSYAAQRIADKLIEEWEEKGAHA